MIFVTAMSEVGDEMKGFALGAVDYITKPISPPIVEARVKAHLENKHARDFIEDRNRVLQGMVLERTRELVATQDATILSMATLAETRDPETGHHLRRTQALRARAGRAAARRTRASATSSTTARSSCSSSRPPCTTSARWACPTASCASRRGSRRRSAWR